MMEGIMQQMQTDMGGKVEGDMIYVYVAGYRPLDLRNEVWMKWKSDNPGINEVAQIGVVNANTAAETANQAVAALQANPKTVAIVAPYDEFTKGRHAGHSGARPGRKGQGLRNGHLNRRHIGYDC